MCTRPLYDEAVGTLTADNLCALVAQHERDRKKRQPDEESLAADVEADSVNTAFI